MRDYMNLIGAEDVRAAGRQMASAAEEMQRAASNMCFAFEQHQRFLDDWLVRFAETLEGKIK